MNRFLQHLAFRGGRLSYLAVFAVVLGGLAVVALAAETDAQALAQADEQWSKAAQSRDAERVASFYAEDAIAYPPGEAVAVGRAAAKKVWASYFAEPSFLISWKAATVEVAKSGDMGVTAGAYEASFNGPDGKQIVDKGKYLCVWKKQADGTWKATHDIWNSDGK